MRLFTYCIPIDDGAAPNPFWGVCTLAICKPAIRRVAGVGDWVAGTGSKNVGGIDYSGKLVYAMKVTEVLTMPAYEQRCLDQLPEKVPDITHDDYRRRLGDSIYRFQGPEDENPSLLRSVHQEINRPTDIGGKNVLLSEKFYYFGSMAIDIPAELMPVIKQGQGHRSNSNAPYALAFVDWIRNTGFPPNQVLGEPQLEVRFDESGCISTYCQTRHESALNDENLESTNRTC